MDSVLGPMTLRHNDEGQRWNSEKSGGSAISRARASHHISLHATADRSSRSGCDLLRAMNDGNHGRPVAWPTGLYRMSTLHLMSSLRFGSDACIVSLCSRQTSPGIIGNGSRSGPTSSSGMA